MVVAFSCLSVVHGILIFHWNDKKELGWCKYGLKMPTYGCYVHFIFNFAFFLVDVYRWMGAILFTKIVWTNSLVDNWVWLTVGAPNKCLCGCVFYFFCQKDNLLF